jgi:transcriptional regulator with XRE-family HTH domain
VVAGKNARIESHGPLQPVCGSSPTALPPLVREAAAPARAAPPDAGRSGRAAVRTAWPGIFGSAAASRCIRAGLGNRRSRRDKREENTVDILIENVTSLSPALPEDDTPGGRLRRARLSKNMLLVDLAKATGLSVESLRSAEQNKTAVTPPNLRVLADALDVSVAYLGCFENLPEETLGQRIKKARLYHGYTKIGFARIFGLSSRMIQGWEKDEYLPPEKYMSKLKELLQILDE